METRITFQRLSTAGGYGYAIRLEVFDPYNARNPGWKMVSFKRLVWDEPANCHRNDIIINHTTLMKITNFIVSRKGDAYGCYRMRSSMTMSGARKLLKDFA